MSGEPAPVPSSIHLLLCDYARRGRELTVDILGGGRRQMPRSGDWYLGGTIDAKVSDLQRVSLWVSDMEGKHLPDTDIEVEVSGDHSPPDSIARIVVADQLPRFDLDPALYLLCCQVGDRLVQLPFFVPEGLHEDEDGQSDGDDID